MWINVPRTQFRGPHAVFVPKGFNRTPDDFATNGEFLTALREFHKSNAQSQLRLL